MSVNIRYTPVDTGSIIHGAGQQEWLTLIAVFGESETMTLSDDDTPKLRAMHAVATSGDTSDYSAYRVLYEAIEQSGSIRVTAFSEDD